MRRTFPALPVEPTEPAPLFRKQSKGSTPQGLTLNPAPFLFPSLHFLISSNIRRSHVGSDHSYIRRFFMAQTKREFVQAAF